MLMAVGVWARYAHSRTCFQAVAVFLVAMDAVDLVIVATSLFDTHIFQSTMTL